MNSPSLGYILQYYWHRIHIYFQVTMTTLVENSQAQLTESNVLNKSLISTLIYFSINDQKWTQRIYTYIFLFGFSKSNVYAVILRILN